MLRITQQLQSFLRLPVLSNSNQCSVEGTKISSFVNAFLMTQTREAFSAVKRGDSNFLEKVTGFEGDPEKRKAMTSQFKNLGLSWNQDSKSWVPKSDIPFEKIAAILKSENGNGEVAPVKVATSSSSKSYAARIDELLKSWESSLEKVLPKQMKKEKFVESLKVALLAAERVGQGSSDEALRTASMKCAELGLVPGPLQECYFSVRDNQVEFLLGYKGIISLARRASPNLQIETNVVRKGDKFSYTLGTSPWVSLEQTEDANPEDIEFAYVLIRFPGGVEKLSVVDRSHVEKRKACSKGTHSPTSPWNKFKREMWLKTALKEGFRFVNLTPETGVQSDVNEAMQSLKVFAKSLHEELEEMQAKEVVDQLGRKI